jgi:hypothetical protein
MALVPPLVYVRVLPFETVVMTSNVNLVHNMLTFDLNDAV